jgi:protein tyrosine phosphatase (PTP) superfamily phosphohydrolase (DUF442 family)
VEMAAAPVLFSPVQAFCGSGHREKLLLLCSLLFRRSAPVEMAAASVLFSPVQAFCASGHREKLLLFCSLLFRRSPPVDIERSSFCSVLFC